MRHFFVWMVWTAWAACSAGASGCSAGSGGTAGDDAKHKDAKIENDEQFHARLREIAQSYKQYQPVDFAAGWAPVLCRRPIPYQDFRPAEAHPSSSADPDTHGQKLYFLFAGNREAYLKLAGKPQAGGQVIVKESWTPREATEEERDLFVSRLQLGGAEVPFARKDGKLYRTDHQGDLFIMFKTAADNPGTDRGWVYGTVTPGTRTVTSAGRVASCMSCHKAAKHDRLFGLPGELEKLPFEQEKLPQPPPR